MLVIHKTTIMKKLMLLVLALSATAGSYATTIVSGKVKGMRSGSVKISYRHPITMVETTVTGELSKGRFSLEMPIDEPRIVGLTIEKERTSVYLMPNEQLSVNLDYDLFDETLEYEGASSNESHFLKEYFLNFEDEGKDPTRGWISELEGKEYFEKQMERLKAKLAFIEEYHSANKLNEQFLNDWKANQTHKTNGDLLYYPRIKAAYTKTSSYEVVDRAYYSFLDDCETNADDLVHLDGYMWFLNGFVNYKVSQLRYKSEAKYDPINHFMVAQIMLSGKCRVAAQAYDLRHTLRRIDLDKIDPYWDDFLSESDEDVAEYMQNIYDRVLALQPGKLSPQFTLMSIDGEEVSLSDFKGKVVYLDFWASWCGPCIREVPYAKELQKEFEGTDVVFLYVSLDENDEAWRKAVEEKELSGVHLLAKGFKHEVPVSYNVSGIPTYYIIGRDGNIYRNNAPRPSSGDTLKDLLKAALEG